MTTANKDQTTYCYGETWDSGHRGRAHFLKGQIMYEELKVELIATRQHTILGDVEIVTENKKKEGYFLKSVLITAIWFSEAQRKKQPNSYKATIIYGRRV